MILRGIFLCTDQDLKWLYQEGANRIYPDYWEDFIHPIPEPDRSDIISSYFDRLTGPNDLIKMSAAKAWSLWEARCSTLRPSHSLVEHFTDPHTALALARIETHYFKNKGFLETNQLLENAGQLNGIPGIIVHGRYDMVCPVDNAFELHRVWHDSQLHLVRDAGHSASEPSIVDALIHATRDVAKRFSDQFDL